ncbi:DNA-processing protein DprA [Dokdonella sp.]|uniref:DNA-processing protein DprA n=1 Tax=Dokdonella sp. TaxID=2291710 RepID=UPI0039C87172
MEAWLILLRTPGLGPATLRKQVARHGSAEDVLKHFRSGRDVTELDDQARRWLDAPDAQLIESDLAWLAASNHHLLGWDDNDYPSLLREIPGAPAALFIDGDASLLWMPQIAIVGSRSASEAGMAITRRFSRALAGAGFAITSGMADGIDAAAHRAALDARGQTLAVLGTGPDLVYPRKHRALAADIAASGALVSEFPPGTPGKAEHFPRRNRIISGLALGTLVVEASMKSGSLITARYATEQGREVFAIPGSINSPLARGCHQLIRDGARLTETVDEIIGELSGLAAALGDRLRLRLQVPDDAGSPLGSPASKGRLKPQRDADYQRLLEALGHEEVDLDTLADRTRLDAGALSSMLLLLELEGEVSSARGGKYQRTPLD